MNALARYQRVYPLVCILFLGIGGGCETIPSVPPPEAVLAGTWDLTPDQYLGLAKNVFVFDELGRITEMRSVFLAITVTERDVHRSTSVVDRNVSIATTGNLIFDGTFNDDFTIATGKLTTEFTIPFTSTEISIDQGNATLTQQQ
ncbi:MAG: hypothetical protein ABII12_05110 [Planctomycetota bacterium]